MLKALKIILNFIIKAKKRLQTKFYQIPYYIFHQFLDQKSPKTPHNPSQKSPQKSTQKKPYNSFITVPLIIPKQQQNPKNTQTPTKMSTHPQTQPTISQLYQSQQYLSDTLYRIDDEYFCRSGYFETHDISFQLNQVTYGNQEIRNHYNITKELKRYFGKRYFFFSLFDQGIQLDTQSWYSVVAEPISVYLCERLKFYGVKKLFQPFSGVGGIAVHAAGNFEQLVVNDIDPNKIKMLKNNLSVYGKGLNLLTIHNKDYAKIKPTPVDAVMICPPWGGINVSQYAYRDLDQIMKPALSDILNHCKKFSKNIVLQMPKNTNLKSLLKIINGCFLNPVFKVEKIIVDGRLSQLFVFIGDIKFTACNPEVFNQILLDSRRQVKNAKLIKKDLKKKIQQENYDIFTEIFQIENIKPNKHIFFDE